MCGIAAFLLSDNLNAVEKWCCFNVLILSLKALQNLGYDSCGVIIVILNVYCEQLKNRK